MFSKKYILLLFAIMLPICGFLYYKISLPKTTEVSEKIEICEEHGFNKKNCYQCNPHLLNDFKGTHDWCVEHNLPESQCELCDPFAKFKAKGDWCKEHGAPESQCVKCNPDLATDLPQFVDWCEEHSIPESQCNLCNDNLKFSLKSDWCQDHSVRDSECVLCHPELKKPKASSSTISAGKYCEHGFEKGNCFRCDSSLEAEFKKTGDWCGGHDIPESQCFKCQKELQGIVDRRLAASDNPEGKYCEHGFEKGNCFRCDSSLEAEFKKTGDWCGGHDIPESQCFKCQKELQGIIDERLKISTVRTDLLNAPKDIEVVAEKNLPASAFCGTHLLRIKLSSKDMAAKVGLGFSLIKKKRLSENINANAEAMYPENKTLSISSRFTGIVKEIKVQLGEKVKKGQPLAIVESPELGELLSDYDTQNQILVLNKRIYDNTKSLIEELKINTLSASDLSNKLSSLQVGEAKVELLNIIANMKTAEKQLELQRELQKEKLGKATEYLNAQREFETSYSKLGATAEKYLLKIQKDLIVQEGQVNKLKRKLSWLKSKASGSEYQIVSSQDGTVISLNITKGMEVQEGNLLFKISDLRKMWVKVNLKLEEALRVKVGQQLKFITDNKSNPQSFDGKVFWLGSEVDDKTRTVEILGEVDTQENLLRNNTFGKALIRIHDKSDVVVVPKASIQWEGCCHVVFVKLKDDVFAPRKVKLGYEGSNFFEVEAGLMEGEIVVTRGSFLLKTEILKSSIGAGCTD